jgi:hypothetical protein
VGRSTAAHAADRTLDVLAPGFRWATTVGAVLAVLLVGGVKLLLVSRARAHEEADRLRSERSPERMEAP